MRKTFVIARRELGNNLFSPMAYVIGAVFLALTGIFFFFGFPPLGVPPVFESGGEASLRQLFLDLGWIMVFVAPLLTMRLMSDEYSSGTIEKLITAPISETEIILGKFLGVFALYAVLLATTLAFLGLLASYSTPDPGVAIMGYLGMLLLGAAFLAVGLFASCLTRYQVLAALIGMVILALFTFLMALITTMGTSAVPTFQLDAMTWLRSFARGTFDTRGLAYFATAAALFLFLAVKALESRRWR